ncbi:type VI secretion system baseplate subunit TssK [Enterobacter ludwigii]|jgi:type VI secretion system protein ImpJ|uniref:type VI secretion system baseplate subunit TssK n=1 Tax=Enterobacter ludwigii TaxID=299767 RepID=UPI001D006F3A|nr:type VI secretion system baseplate subunit TssK [Enterobacter ludwigii]
MKIYRPLWNEGALLSPQQFQQQAEWESFRSAGASALASPFPWGVEKIEFNDSLLSSGLIQITLLRLWLDDGSLIDAQRSDLPPRPRELDASQLAGLDSVTVVIALPHMQPGIANVEQEGVTADRPLRYREEWVTLQDAFGSEEESIAVARYNFTIRFAHESNDSWKVCPVARLIRDGQNAWRLDPSFIPPVASFAASPVLRERLVLLNRQLRSRRQRLMTMRRESNERLADFAVADVSLFWLLNALNSHARVLTEYERFPSRPPEQVWAELARLAGSMLTFSLNHDLDAIPGYDHEEPANAFPPLFDLITGLLEASLPSRVIALEMSRPDGQTWKANLHDIRLREEADLWLSVRSDIPAWQVAEKFPALCQAGSPDDVSEIYGAALKGIRAGKGLFISADAQAKAQGEALDMDAALKEIDRLNQQLQQLEIAAENAQALKADVDSQIQMFEQRLKPLNEALLFSAPEGMALTCGEDMQLAAARNLVVNAGGDISVGTMGNLTALAGEKLGLFARTGQLSVKSGEGPVEVQAQNASLRLFAEKKLTLSSANDISLAGKKRITLIGGGSYLRLEAGKVEYGTTASYMRKVKRTMAAGAASQQPEMPWLADPVKSTASVLMQYLYHDDVPVVGASFKVTLADGSVREGNLDGAGYLHLEDVPPGSVQVEFGPDIRNYLRKNKIDNQSFVGTSLSEADIDSLIAKHSGGVE